MIIVGGLMVLLFVLYLCFAEGDGNAMPILLVLVLGMFFILAGVADRLVGPAEAGTWTCTLSGAGIKAECYK